MARFTIYRSSDEGAPALTGEVGKLVALLDACLVNGYTGTVSSITRSGGTATVTVPGGFPHNLITGQSVTIAGADQSDYNITASVTVTSATTFTYAVGGTPATPATGVITYLRIAAGWTKPFTGTNKAAFLQGAGSNGFYVRIQDDAPATAKEARIRGFETMSDVDTGTGPFPTVGQFANGLFCRKSASADATARNWIVVADSRTFYLFVLTGDTAGVYLTMWYGEFYSLLPSDGFRVGIIGRNIENNGGSGFDCLPTLRNALGTQVSANYIARGHNGTGGSVNIGKHGDFSKSNNDGTSIYGIVPYTNPANGAFYLSRIWISDPTTTPVNGLRGRMRGFWHFLHPLGSVTDGDVLIGTGELAGKTFLIIKQAGDSSTGSYGVYTIETSNTVETN